MVIFWDEAMLDTYDLNLIQWTLRAVLKTRDLQKEVRVEAPENTIFLFDPPLRK
jgi:hypothetical protein